MTGMVRIYDPAQLTYSRLREFAVVAAWIATLAESANDLEDLLIDMPPEERVLPDFSERVRNPSIKHRGSRPCDRLPPYPE